MKLGRKLASGLAVTIALALGGSSAWAGTTNAYYSETLGPFAGVGTTATQTKTYTGMAGYVTSYEVGGSYLVTAKMRGDTSGTWTGYVIGDGTTHYLHNSLVAGDSVWAVFQNRPQTTVRVAIAGQWRSN